MKYTKERRDGYVLKAKTEGRQLAKLPFYCPREQCRRLTDSLDDSYVKKYGVCAVCYINLVENRNKPLIDTEKYRQRLEDRGY